MSRGVLNEEANTRVNWVDPKSRIAKSFLGERADKELEKVHVAMYIKLESHGAYQILTVRTLKFCNFRYNGLFKSGLCLEDRSTPLGFSVV